MAPWLLAELTDSGHALDCVTGAEAVVHPPAIPAGGIRTHQTTFRTNMSSTYNVFEAARRARSQARDAGRHMGGARNGGTPFYLALKAPPTDSEIGRRRLSR